MSEENGDENGTTTSTRTRWKYIGTLLSGLILVSLPLVVVSSGSGYFDTSQVGREWFYLYSFVVSMATVWVFGEDTLKAVQAARGK